MRLLHRLTSASTTSRRAASAALAAGLASAILLAPAPASAAPPGDCPYPNVCVYNSSWVRTGMWKQITTGWQPIQSAPRYAYNSRHDDVAYFRGSLGVGCVEPGRTANLSNIGTVTGIRISSEARCFS